MLDMADYTQDASEILKHGAQGLVTKWCDGKGYGLFMNAEGASSFASTIR